MAHSPKDLVQRKHNYAIIDETDSVLIDDARTPLIISGPVPEGDRQEFDVLKAPVENIVQKQRTELIQTLAQAKKLIADGDQKDNLYFNDLLRAVDNGISFVKHPQFNADIAGCALIFDNDVRVNLACEDVLAEAASYFDNLGIGPTE